MGPVDVVEARDAGLHAKVLAVVDGQLLHGQLLQAVGVLGLGGPRVGLLQRHVLRLELCFCGMTCGRKQEDEPPKQKRKSNQGQERKQGTREEERKA